MPELHPSLRDLAMPVRIASRPRDHRGFPVPWFVGEIDGKPDFRLIGPGKLERAFRHHRCWLCGEQLGANMAFVIGPMCVVNRTTSEPPSHRDCAQYAVLACPFLTNPDARYRESGMPATRVPAAGLPSHRKPGVTALVMARRYKVFHPHGGNQGVLFRIEGEMQVSWWTRGREATREEALAGLAGSLPILRAEAAAQGEASLRHLAMLEAKAMRHLPSPPTHGSVPLHGIMSFAPGVA